VKTIEKTMAVFFLVMGISILLVWTMLLVSGDVPVRSTGLFLIVSIVLLVLSLRQFDLRNSLVKFGLFSIGLSVYLFLNLAGIQGGQGEWAFFTILVYLICTALFFVFRLAGLNTKTV